MLRNSEAPPAHQLQTVYLSGRRSAGGWVRVNPPFAEVFKRLGITTADAFFDLPGEVVSGHPDRHVLRVRLAGLAAAFYLKRQHLVRLSEKLRNWWAGFGWTSRCEHEGKILAELESQGLPGPRWAAVGVDREGRAFLLVEELAGAIELRQYLAQEDVSREKRAALAKRLGQTIASIHAAAFTTPELTAKHVLIDPDSQAIAIIDWQSSRRGRGSMNLINTLAALHASVAEHLASPRERLRVLSAALKPHHPSRIPGVFRGVARVIAGRAANFASRRSIRDQRQASLPIAQRLVWVAGECVCAIPEVAAHWPSPAIAPPFYGCEPGAVTTRLPDCREAVLIRGRLFDPRAMLVARLRSRAWRSPGVALGRLLFHLERYGIAAPRLLAFGQRKTGIVSAEWFTLHTLPAKPIRDLRDPRVARRLGRRLRQLHDAGCSVAGSALPAFGEDRGDIVVRDVQALRLVRPRTDRELTALLAELPPEVQCSAWEGYHDFPRASPQQPDNSIENRLKRVDVTG